MRLAHTLLVLVVALAAVGCAPWYAKYGIADEAQLRSPAAAEGLVAALADDTLPCDRVITAALHLARAPEAVRANRELVANRTRQCLSTLIEDDVLYYIRNDKLNPTLKNLLTAYRPVEPEVLVPALLTILLAGNEASYVAAMALGELGHASDEVLSALDVTVAKYSGTNRFGLASNALNARDTLRALAAGGHATDDKPRVEPREVAVLAIFDVQDPSEQMRPEVMEQLTEYLITRVAEGTGYRIVPRDQLRARLQGEKVGSYRACYDQSCQIELGKAIAAEKTLASKLLKVGETCAITATLYDLKTETAERGASVRVACEDSKLMDGMDQIARQLTEKAGEGKGK